MDSRQVRDKHYVSLLRVFSKKVTANVSVIVNW